MILRNVGTYDRVPSTMILSIIFGPVLGAKIAYPSTGSTAEQVSSRILGKRKMRRENLLVQVGLDPQPVVLMTSAINPDSNIRP